MIENLYFQKKNHFHLLQIQQWASPIWDMCAYSITRNKVEWVDHAQPCIVPPSYEPNCCFLSYGYLSTLNSSTLIKVTFNLDDYSNSYPLPNYRKLILPKKESSFITNPTMGFTNLGHVRLFYNKKQSRMSQPCTTVHCAPQLWTKLLLSVIWVPVYFELFNSNKGDVQSW